MTGAMATGIMNNMAPQENSGFTKRSPTQGAAAMPVKSTLPSSMAAMYPTMIPANMGISLSNPFANMLVMMAVVAR